MFLERLRRIYSRICKCYLVRDKNTDIQSIEYFEAQLNESLPLNNAEFEVKVTLRKLYYSNRIAFLNLIQSEPYFILITDIKDIVSHFNLNHIIFIKYTTTYKVSLFLQRYY